jgi:hypothetical protein
MPKGSRCFGSHATRIAINGSLAAENSGHVSGTVKHSQYECAVVERLEDDQVISVCANPYRVAQVWTRHVVMRSVGDLLAVLPYLANERDSAPRMSSTLGVNSNYELDTKRPTGSPSKTGRRQDDQLIVARSSQSLAAVRAARRQSRTRVTAKVASRPVVDAHERRLWDGVIQDQTGLMSSV